MNNNAAAVRSAQTVNAPHSVKQDKAAYRPQDPREEAMTLHPPPFLKKREEINKNTEYLPTTPIGNILIAMEVESTALLFKYIAIQ